MLSAVAGDGDAIMADRKRKTRRFAAAAEGGAPGSGVAASAAAAAEGGTAVEAEGGPGGAAEASPSAVRVRDKEPYSADWLALHCLGFGSCWGWVHVAFFSTVLWGGASEELSLTAWLVNVFANGCAMIAFGCLAARRSPLGSRRGFAVALAALTVAGTVGLSLGQALSDAWVYAAAVSSGVGTAGLLLVWAEAYRGIPPTYAKRRTIPASMIMGVFYYLLIGMLPHVAAVAATMLLPVVSVALLRQTRRMEEAATGGVEGEASPSDGAEGCAWVPSAAGQETRTPIERDRAVRTSDGRGGQARGKRFGSLVRGAVPVRFVAFTAVYCLAPGFMRGHTSALPFASAGGIGEAMFAGVAVVMIAVAVASIVLFGEAKIDVAYKLVVPLMAAGLLLLPFLAAGQEAVAAVAIMSGYILFEMYVWASLADRASNVGAPTALVFGLGKVGMNAGLLAGTFVGFHFGSSSSMLLVGVLVFIVYLFIVMESAASPGIGVALSLARPDREAEGADGPGRVTLVEAAQMDLSEVFSAMVDERCAAVSQTHGLSARETEVLALLARGRSLQSIADALGVAYSTVKTHTDRIYAKTDVHSRQELIALLEQTDGREDV